MARLTTSKAKNVCEFADRKGVTLISNVGGQRICWEFPLNSLVGENRGKVKRNPIRGGGGGRRKRKRKRTGGEYRKGQNANYF